MQQDSFSQDLALKISLYIYTHTQNKLEFSLFGGRGDTQRTPTTPHRSLGDVVVLLICSWTWWQTREWCGQHIGWPSLLLQFQELNAQSLTRERTCVITISVANKFLLEKSDIYFFFCCSSAELIPWQENCMYMLITERLLICQESSLTAYCVKWSQSASLAASASQDMHGDVIHYHKHRCTWQQNRTKLQIQWGKKVFGILEARCMYVYYCCSLNLHKINWNPAITSDNSIPLSLHPSQV